MAQWRNYFVVKGLEVSKGGAVRRTYDDKRTWNGKSIPTMLERQVDKDGNLYVEIRKPKQQNLRIDELVAKCFLPAPTKGQTILIHIDNNKEHCWADNLKWVTPIEYAEIMNPKSEDGFRLYKANVYVSKNAEIKENGKILTVGNSFYDRDTDLEAAIDPYVRLDISKRSGEREYLEDLVAATYLKCPNDITSPALLHKDMDYTNCALDNLEWVESDSDEFINYVEKRKADMRERTIELNPHMAEYLRSHYVYE